MTEQAQGAAKRQVKTFEETIASVRANSRSRDTKRASSNPIAKIFEDPKTTLEEKKKLVLSEITFVQDEKLVKERLEQMNSFLAQVAEEREQDARSIIKLTDTDATSRMRSAFDNVGNRLGEFKELSQPILDLVNAVAKLNANGVTMGVFNEVRDEMLEAERIQDEIKVIKQQIVSKKENRTSIEYRIATLRDEKVFGFFGPVKASAKARIENAQQKIANTDTAIEDLEAQIQELREQQPKSSEYEDFVNEKEQLRQLLSFTPEEHKDMQEQLVTAAYDFVDSVKEEFSGVLDQYRDLDDQIGSLSSSNYDKSIIFGVITDASTEILKTNEEMRQEIEAMPEDDEVDRLKKEQARRIYENYASQLNIVQADAQGVAADLNGERIRVDTMKTTAENQIRMARQMQTSGVASVASSAATMLQAISASAIQEANEVAKGFLMDMNETTLETSRREIVRAAMVNKGINTDLAEKLTILGEMGETLRAGTELKEQTLDEMRDLVDALRQQTEDTSEAIKDDRRITADRMSALVEEAEEAEEDAA